VSDAATEAPRTGKVEVRSSDEFNGELLRLQQAGKIVTMIERGKPGKSLWILHWHRNSPVVKQANLL
jgi:hypothetical protein